MERQHIEPLQDTAGKSGPSPPPPVEGRPESPESTPQETWWQLEGAHGSQKQPRYNPNGHSRKQSQSNHQSTL